MIDNSPFETLIKCKKVSNRWYPQSIPMYKTSLNIDKSIKNSDALHRNIAYNLQYIEFLEKEFSELELSSVIYTMLVKTFIITGMSILEGIFSNIIKSNNFWKTSNLESLGVVQSSEKNFSGKNYIVKTELLIKTDKYDLQMNLDDMIKILDSHHDLLKIDHLIYPALRRLKDLRNRIHLQKSETETDHDYNAFSFQERKEMREILYSVLTSPSVTSEPEVFEFLHTNIKPV